MSDASFYCPVYEGEISQYDCDEISTGIHRGRFVNDGLPHLMDIRLAIGRKLRCQACARCPAHYQPPGLPLMLQLKHLGFDGDLPPDKQLLRTEDWLHYIVAGMDGHASEVRSGNISCYQLPSGIQLWLEWDPQLNMTHDWQAHFFTPNAMYLRADTIIRHDRPGQLVRSSFMAKLLREASQKDSLLRQPFFSPNLSMMKREAAGSGNLVAQVTAFPAKLTVFKDPEAYLAQREVELSTESFVSGLSMPGADPGNPGADALLTGIVEKVNTVTNELTSLPFYHIELKCLGLTFDLVADTSLFEQPPVPGNVLQGVCWLSARILDYGYTGYEFESDVTTPLTAARFEPYRLILQNLQPGERVFCGIDPPLNELVFIRAKGEVEGISVELREDPQVEEEEEAQEQEAKADQPPFRIVRFYPVSRETAIQMFESTLVFQFPPRLANGTDVTDEYLRMEQADAPEESEREAEGDT